MPPNDTAEQLPEVHQPKHPMHALTTYKGTTGPAPRTLTGEGPHPNRHRCRPVGVAHSQTLRSIVPSARRLR